MKLERGIQLPLFFVRTVEEAAVRPDLYRTDIWQY